MQRWPRGAIDEAALALLERHGAQILATARRYAATPEDAEDAYQRAFEILLTKHLPPARTSSSHGSRS
jgi:DNA-directed RNA polymerase specialized sigma24 family protein